MKRFCFWLLLLRMPLASLAQQIICERQLLTAGPRYQRPAALLRLQADSLRLVDDYYPTGPTAALQSRVQRLNLATCDTLPAGPAVFRVDRTGPLPSVEATNRRGQVLLSQTLTRLRVTGSHDSARIVLQLFNRNGTPRWRHTLAPQSIIEGVSSIIEAPENGFFLFGNEYHPALSGPGITYDIVLRLDSTGRELWRRHYRRLINDLLANPTYTRVGTIICTADYTALSMAPVVTLMEFNQRGDSLTTHPVTIVAQQYTGVYRLGTKELSTNKSIKKNG